MSDHRGRGRQARSGAVIVLFVAALGALVWMWVTTQSTSAAFGDREVVGGNHLGAGTVDIAVGDDTIGFAAVNMAAGDVATGQLELVNRGTLPFRYSLSATVGDGPLLEVLELVAWRGDPNCAETPPASAISWRPLADGATGGGGSSDPTIGRLAPEQSHLLCLRAELPFSVPNRYQGERLQFVIAVTAVHDVEESP